jgi:hypothetical protein
MLSLLLGHCASEAPVSRDELAAIHDGRSAVILLRLVGKNQRGEPLKPLPEVQQIDRRFENADLELGGVPLHFKSGPLSYRILSEEGQMEGWVAFIRPPGYYYLAFRTPGAPRQPPPDERGEPPFLRWRVEVRPGTAVVYAGTLRLSGSTFVPLSGWCRDRGCKNDDLFVWIDQTTAEVENESDAAAQMARRDLPTLPPPLTRLAVRQDGPLLLGIPAPVQ